MRRLTLAGLLLLTVLGCGGSDGDPTGPDGNGNGNLPNGSMSARIDGSSWSATSAIAATYTGGIVAIAGSNASLTTIGFAVIASAPGTYAIGPASPTNAILTVGSAGATWQASSIGGTGSITITSLSATAAAGTFTFNLVADGTSGSSGTRTVTNGTFNVTF